jgi:hypothetical protein
VVLTLTEPNVLQRWGDIATYFVVLVMLAWPIGFWSCHAVVPLFACTVPDVRA